MKLPWYLSYWFETASMFCFAFSSVFFLKLSAQFLLTVTSTSAILFVVVLWVMVTTLLAGVVGEQFKRARARRDLFLDKLYRNQ